MVCPYAKGMLNAKAHGQATMSTAVTTGHTWLASLPHQ